MHEVTPPSGRGQGKFALGRQVAAVLAGAWRPKPPPLTVSTETFIRIIPRLLEKGEAGLVCRRLRSGTDLLASDTFAPPVRPGIEQLLQEYRLQTLHAALHVRRIEETAGRLRQAGVEPLLFKGWAVARLYPEPGLRPFCDIDCLVPAEQFAIARAALDAAEAGDTGLPADPGAHSEPLACGPAAHLVDLHYRLPDLADRTLQELYDRSRLVPLGATAVRVLGPEDQLRLSALHFLRHSGWRPLWLCDIALMLETVGTDFDWDYCLRGSPRERDWLLCAFELSHQLLGACVDRLPAVHRTRRLASWLPRTVLRHWGSVYWGSYSRPMASYLRTPAGLRQALGYRWADPIAVTLRWRLPMNGAPRLPLQVGDYLARAAGMVGRWLLGSTGARAGRS
jgi:hypothetical protein